MVNQIYEIIYKEIENKGYTIQISSDAFSNYEVCVEGYPSTRIQVSMGMVALSEKGTIESYIREAWPYFERVLEKEESW